MPEYPSILPVKSYENIPWKSSWKPKEEHLRAAILWYHFPSDFTVPVLAWLSGMEEDAIENLARRQGWKSRKEMRREEKNKNKAIKIIKELSIPPTDEKYFPDPVSLVRMVRVCEKKAELEMDQGNPTRMSAWLNNLTSVDLALRLRRARQQLQEQKEKVMIYLPKEDDPIPPQDAPEDAVIVESGRIEF